MRDCREWEIRDEDGELHAHHGRFDNKDGKKFLWRLPEKKAWGGLDGRRVDTLPLYGSERLRGYPTDSPVVLTEGEKSADALLDAGLPAFGTVTGASGTPGKEALEVLRGRVAILWPDNDDTGRKHMERIAEALQSVATEVRVFKCIHAEDKEDAADHPALVAGFADEAEDLRQALEASPVWRPGMMLSENGLAGESREVGVLLSDVVPERVEWLWRGRIPLGKITVLDGNPGLGKSTAAIDFAARVSAGGVWPDGSECETGGVVIINLEDGLADTTVPRFLAAGGDASKAVALSTVLDSKGHERLISIPDDLPQIERAIERVAARYVVVDPLMALLSSSVNSNSDQDVRGVLAPLAMLGEKTGAAIVLVRHLNKAAGGAAIYRGGGSIGIIGAARSGLLIAEHPEDETKRVMASVKNNLAAPAPSLVFSLASTESGVARVKWSGQTILDANSLLSAPVDQEEKSALTEAEDFLLDILQDGAMPVKDVEADARQAGIEHRTLKRAKQKLKIISEREGTAGQRGGGRWVWRLPEDIKETKQNDGSLNTEHDYADASYTRYVSGKADPGLRRPSPKVLRGPEPDGPLNNGHAEAGRERLVL